MRQMSGNNFFLPVKNMGIDIKNPPTAQTRLTLDFCKYLFPLQINKKEIINNEICRYSEGSLNL